MIQVVIGALCISTAPILVKFAQLDPSSLGFFRVFFGFLILLPFFGWRGNTQGLSSKTMAPIFLGGLFFALDLFCWHRSIYIVGAGMATILGNSQAFYLAVIGGLFFKEKLSWKFYISLVLAFIGVSVLVNPLADRSTLPENYFLGIFYGLVTGLFYSGYIVCLRFGQGSLNHMKPAKKLGLICAATSLFMFLISFIDSGLHFPNSSQQWGFTLLVALIPQVIGWIFITNGLPKIPISRSGVILLLQPILATILGMIIFKEQMSLLQLLGGALTIFAIYLANSSKKTTLQVEELVKLEE